MKYTRYSRCIVRSIWLKLTISKRLLKGISLLHILENSICLITICYDSICTTNSYWCIYDKAWILKLCWIKCFCSYSLAFCYEYSVTTVLRTSHNKVSNCCLLTIWSTSNNDTSSWIAGCSDFCC